VYLVFVLYYIYGSLLQLLKILNSNTENPYLIWDNATRAQLNEYLLDNEKRMVRNVGHVEFTLLSVRSTVVVICVLGNNDTKFCLDFLILVNMYHEVILPLKKLQCYVDYLQGECDQSFGATFEFEIHAKELVVGEIYVRIYNEQPTFPLEVSRYC
jgi:hypothetical protein